MRAVKACILFLQEHKPTDKSFKPLSKWLFMPISTELLPRCSTGWLPPLSIGIDPDILEH